MKGDPDTRNHHHHPAHPLAARPHRPCAVPPWRQPDPPAAGDHSDPDHHPIRVAARPVEDGKEFAMLELLIIVLIILWLLGYL